MEITSSILRSLERRLQVLLGVVLFLPAIFDALDRDIGALDDATLGWGMTVGFLLTAYLLIEFSRDQLGGKAVAILNVLVTFNLLMFVPLFIMIGAYKDVLPSGSIIFYTIVLGAVLWTPIVIMLLGLAFWCDYIVSKISTRIDGWKKNKKRANGK